MIPHKPQGAFLLPLLVLVWLSAGAKVRAQTITIGQTESELTPSPTTTITPAEMTVTPVAPDSPTGSVTPTETLSPITNPTPTLGLSPSPSDQITQTPQPSEGLVPTGEPLVVLTPTPTELVNGPTEIPMATASPTITPQPPTETPVTPTGTTNVPPEDGAPPGDGTDTAGQTQNQTAASSQVPTVEKPAATRGRKTAQTANKPSVNNVIEEGKETIGKIDEIMKTPLTFNLRGVSKDAYPEEKQGMAPEEKRQWLLGGVGLIVMGTFLADPTLGTVLKRIWEGLGRVVSIKELSGLINRLL